jgi:inner membrane protein
MTTARLASRIWFISALSLGAGILIYILLAQPWSWLYFLPACPVILAGGVPVFIAMAVLLPRIRKSIDSYHNKIYLSILSCGVCACVYGFAGFFFRYAIGRRLSGEWLSEAIEIAGVITAILFGCSLLALLLSKKQLSAYFENNKPILKTNNHTKMETIQHAGEITGENKTHSSNKILIKGAITAALIGIMMIPTVFISDLVRERQSRNEAVVKEVDSRWAMAQTLSGPYIYLPYHVLTTDAAGKPVIVTNHLLMIPYAKQVTGKINHEIRERSIYKVLLYRASLTDQGDFILNLPKEVNASQILLRESKKNSLSISMVVTMNFLPDSRYPPMRAIKDCLLPLCFLQQTWANLCTTR